MRFVLRSYDKQKNLRPRRNVKAAMQHELSHYAIVQKEGLGFDKCVEDCKCKLRPTLRRPPCPPPVPPASPVRLRVLVSLADRMSRYGVSPNLLIVPPQVSGWKSNQPLVPHAE